MATDDFGVLLRILVMAAEGVLQTLGELPQGLLLRLPRHGGECWCAVRGEVVSPLLYLRAARSGEGGERREVRCSGWEELRAVGRREPEAGSAGAIHC